MTKIILIFWVLTSSGSTEPQTIGDDGFGFQSMDDCDTAAESLTAPNPNDKATGFAVIARCAEVPR